MHRSLAVSSQRRQILLKMVQATLVYYCFQVLTLAECSPLYLVKLFLFLYTAYILIHTGAIPFYEYTESSHSHLDWDVAMYLQAVGRIWLKRFEDGRTAIQVMWLIASKLLHRTTAISVT